ncbi:hypothetical protein Q9966_000527 [Columba livia]|nr:hypothetical protein Q9966_000527 [Columba livia]
MEKSIEVNNRLPDTTKSSTVIKVLPDCTENEKDLVTLSVREIHYEKDCPLSAGTPFPGGTEDANLLICGTLVSWLNQRPTGRSGLFVKSQAQSCVNEVHFSSSEQLSSRKTFKTWHAEHFMQKKRLSDIHLYLVDSHLM